MRNFYARFQAAPGTDGQPQPVRKFGIPEYTTREDGVSQLMDVEMATELTLYRLRGVNLVLLEILYDDGSVAKRVI